MFGFRTQLLVELELQDEADKVPGKQRQRVLWVDLMGSVTKCIGFSQQWVVAEIQVGLSVATMKDFIKYIKTITFITKMSLLFISLYFKFEGF